MNLRNSHHDTGLERPQDSAFDLRARAELALAFDAGEPPAHLLRHTPWYARRSVHSLAAVLLISAAAAAAVLGLRPPELVRLAMEHEYYERTLRGNFISEAELAPHLDWPAGHKLPGFTQLMRPCDIEGQRAYHLTTFFEKGGIVTVLAFEQPTDLADGGGWWSNTYWRVVRSREGKPLVLIAQKKQALAVAARALGPQGPLGPLAAPSPSPMVELAKVSSAAQVTAAGQLQVHRHADGHAHLHAHAQGTVVAGVNPAAGTAH